MCDGDALLFDKSLTRRSVVVGLAGVATSALWATAAHAATTAPSAASVGIGNGAVVRRRDTWDAGKRPGPLPKEQPGEVKALLVHHTDSPNGYEQDRVPDLLRSFRQHHTTTKGWPDVAYNFFIDRFGTIWEGRIGSLAGPVIADATGGNQGHTQLVCLIGSFTSVPPSDAAQSSLAAMLAALSVTYNVAPKARAEFVSRGSNRWKKGSTVSIDAITGHRDTSMTTCPGDAAYALLPGVRTAVSKLTATAVRLPV